jgi:hypothetical protein
MSSDSKVFVGYVNGASWHTRRLASAVWVIFTYQGQLLSSSGISLGDTTNNFVELVVSQLNRVYQVHDPTLHRRLT